MKKVKRIKRLERWTCTAADFLFNNGTPVTLVTAY
jgi:hypothetical protein